MPTTADLGRKVKAKYPGAYDDLPDSLLGARVKAKFPDSYNDFTDPPQEASLPPTALGATVALMSGRLPEFLPSALGAVGGMMGKTGPTRIAGAALGGGAGEGIREVYRGQPLSLGKIGASAGSQAVQQGLGEGLAAGLGKLARPMIRKTVTFQRASTPSVILNEFGKPFMIEGAQVEFKRRAPKEARQAADVLMDVAGHAIPGGALLRPVARGIRGAVASGASGIGSWIGSPGFQFFARNFPRAAAALQQLATHESQPDSTGGQ